MVSRTYSPICLLTRFSHWLHCANWIASYWGLPQTYLKRLLTKGKPSTWNKVHVQSVYGIIDIWTRGSQTFRHAIEKIKTKSHKERKLYFSTSVFQILAGLYLVKNKFLQVFWRYFKLSKANDNIHIAVLTCKLACLKTK